MVRFNTPKLALRCLEGGRYTVSETGNINVPAEASGRWRSKPAGGRLFTPTQVRAIRRDRIDHTYQELAEIYDCSITTIRMIVKRAIYEDV
jgi:hypothetical protein